MKEKTVFYKVIKFILKPIFCLYYWPKIYNKHLIPKEGPIIICGNHMHLYDQCLPIMATKRVVHYMAKKEYFDGKMAWFFKAAGCISVNRGIKDMHAAAQALSVLKQGGAIGIFPEGTRNKTDKVLLPLKPGVVSMAQKTGATIVPFVLKGEYKFLKGVSCTFLEPFKVSKDEDLKKANEHLTKVLYNGLVND